MLLPDHLVLHTGTPFDDALHRAVRHEASKSYAPEHSAWRALCAASYDDTLPNFLAWFEACVEDLGVTAGLYLGFNELGDDQGATYDLRIAGSPWYEREAIWSEIQQQGYVDLRPGWFATSASNQRAPRADRWWSMTPGFRRIAETVRPHLEDYEEDWEFVRPASFAYAALASQAALTALIPRLLEPGYPLVGVLFAAERALQESVSEAYMLGELVGSDYVPARQRLRTGS